MATMAFDQTPAHAGHRRESDRAAALALLSHGGRLLLRVLAVVAGGALVMALVAALLALAGAFPAHAFAAEASHRAAPAAAGDVVAAATALRSIETLRADFVQTDASGQRVNGVLTLKRGGLIRFQYAPGYPMLIVADGKALTVLDTELRKMQRWPVGNSPLGALLDPGKDIGRYGTVAPSFDSRTLDIEVRDRSHPEYGVITLSFVRKAGAPGGLELAGWVTMDAQSRRTIIRLSGHRYGVPVDNDLFRVTNPMARPHP